MSSRLDSKTALVTGATGSIGRAISVAFAREGARVVVSGRDPQRGADVVEEIQRANNAGIFPSSPSSAATDEDTFDRIYAVNVKAPFFLTAAIAPAMAQRGNGVIINLGSWIARLGIPVSSVYSSSKGALETLTRAWAAEYGPVGVRVNAISPGVILSSTSQSPAAEAMMRGTPANTAGTPDAIANAAVYLASDESLFVHGTVIDVDGGRVGVAVIASS